MKTADQLLVIQSSSSAHCGTGEGAACSVPQNGQPTACGCQSEAAPLSPDQRAIKPILSITHKQDSTWQTMRSGVMFVIACIASPCCTPLIVPVVLALLGGTPIAVWMGHNLGLVYGVLTGLSLISFILAFRWMKKDQPQPRQHLQSTSIES